MKKTTKFKLFALAGFVLISGLMFSCKKDSDLPQEEPGDNPITFTVNIPANTVSVNIDRREVTKKGNTYESIEPDDGGWFTIATRYIGEDAEDYSQAKEKSFTDVYGVENGKYYEYRLMKKDTQDKEKFDSLGYFKAGYDGAEFPDFHANQYPVIEWDATDKKLSLTNADTIAFNCKNGEEVLGWVIDVSYDSKDWHWSTFFDKENHTFENMQNDKYDTLKKGNNPISSFSVKINISEQDYFSYQRFYDISEIDAKKVATSIPGKIDAPTSTSVGININVTTPPIPIAQTHIYRKLSTEDDNKFQEVGFHDGWYEEMIFTDYYYEYDKTYDYVAKFTYDDYETYAVMDLGSVTTKNTGLTPPDFKEGKTPEFEWDAKNLELKITNNPELQVPVSAETYWGQDYCWSVVFTYKFPESGFWPQFLFDKNNNPIDNSAEEDAPPNPNIVAEWAIEGMSDNEEDNMLQECVIHIIEEDKFEQCIVLYQMPFCNIFATQDASGVNGERPDWTIEYLSKE
ncbi:MAG: hypothetical protein J5726_08620 [Treponema sp.]|nr:hypothetical protein [Treponema sp.]